MIAKSVLELIGDTPLLELSRINIPKGVRFVVKLEMFNPGGSIKDRIGYFMCQKALEKGLIEPNGVVIEATSGNTGIGIAQFCCVKGLKAIFVMSDKQSQEKINMLKAYGAQVIICPTNVEQDDPRSYYSVAQKLADSIPGSFYANQYDNSDNTQSHYETTGPEIFRQTKGDFDYLVAGVGTGGTISGISKFLKEKMPAVKVIGVDIKGSILAHYHNTGEMTSSAPYLVEGVGDGFLPKNVDFSLIDEFVTVEDEESFKMTRELLAKEGLYIGGSCGAALVGALKHATKNSTLNQAENTTNLNQQKLKTYLIILPDSGSRYLSKVYNNHWMDDHHFERPKLSSSEEALVHQIKSTIPSEVKCV